MEHWLQSAQFGAKWDKNKQQYLNQTHGIRFAQFNDDGEITAQGELSLLNAALSDALKLALALSFKFPKWLPKFNQLRFRTLVERTLRQHIAPEHIITNYTTRGASGHYIQFPFALQASERMILIEPIALKDGKLEWASVYQVHGKFSDIKRIDENSKRLAIIEDGDEKNMGSISTFLANACNVRTIQSTHDWRLNALAY